MGFLAKLFGGGKKSSDLGLYFYVRLYLHKPTPQDEYVKVRVNPEHDLSLDDESKAYFTRKELVGPKHFRRANITLYFDNQRRLQNKEIEGGEFVTQAEYEQAIGQNT